MAYPEQTCVKCGYQWKPVKHPKLIKKCPGCQTLDWRENGRAKRLARRAAKTRAVRKR